MRPGVEIKVERKKRFIAIFCLSSNHTYSVKPSLLNLASKVSLISQIRGPSNDLNRLSSTTALKGRAEDNRESRTAVHGTTVTSGGRTTVGNQMKRSLVTQSKTSVTSIASR